MLLSRRFLEEPETPVMSPRRVVGRVDQAQVRVTFMDASKRSIVRNVKVGASEMITDLRDPFVRETF